MAADKETSRRHVQTRISEELAKIPHEPLLPIEKKLIVWSLILGAALMLILVWASERLFAVP